MTSKYFPIRTPLGQPNSPYILANVLFNRKSVHLVRVNEHKALCGVKRIHGNYVFWTTPGNDRVMEQLNNTHTSACLSCLVATL